MSTPQEILTAMGEKLAYDWAEMLIHAPTDDLPVVRPIPPAAEALDALEYLVNRLEEEGADGDYNTLSDLDNALEGAFYDATVALPPEGREPMLLALCAYVQSNDSDLVAAEDSVRHYREAIRASRKFARE